MSEELVELKEPIIPWGGRKEPQRKAVREYLGYHRPILGETIEWKKEDIPTKPEASPYGKIPSELVPGGGTPFDPETGPKRMAPELPQWGREPRFAQQAKEQLKAKGPYGAIPALPAREFLGYHRMKKEETTY